MGILTDKEFIEKIKDLPEIAFKPGERNERDEIDSHDLQYLESGDFKANLHVHTQYSDGAMSIQELLENANKIPNFTTAITDHDTIDGNKEAYKLIEKFPNVNLCCGVEVSTVGINFPNQKKPVQIHLLAYGIDPFDKRLESYLNEKNKGRLKLTKATLEELNKALPEYKFTLEEEAKCHYMILKGQDEVAHPLKKYTSGKIILDYYFPNAQFSYVDPIKKYKYLFKGQEPYHIIYKKALEMFIGEDLPPIPDNIENKIQIARNIYLKSHPSIGNMLNQFASFEDAVEFIASLDCGVMSIAHPARTKAYCEDFYKYLFKNFKNHGKDKALFYEGYYQSYEGEYYKKWKQNIDNAAKEFGLYKTGGIDSHGHNLTSRFGH